MAALGINLGYLIFQILNFTIVAIILYKLAYNPIITSLETRKQKIAQSLEDVRIAAEARANAEEEARSIVAKAQTDAAERVREASGRAETTAQSIRYQAEEESAKIKEQAKADALLERERILGDLRNQVAALAIAATQKLIGDSLDESRQRGLLDQFFSGVKSGKVVVLEDSTVTGATAEIISALPLTDAEKETVRSEITSKLGAQTIVFRVNPDILGGLVVKVGDKLLDGSIAGQLTGMRERLT
jgi:F-type H+-transporting ATPase subunit b